MQPAEHFLSRLERLSTDEVDFALQLYHDAELLRAVLGAIKLPEAAARVAIALGDPPPMIRITPDAGEAVPSFVQNLQFISARQPRPLGEYRRSLHEDQRTRPARAAL